MITLDLRRPSGSGHHEDAKVYSVSFEGIKYLQHCFLYHKVWDSRFSLLEVRNGKNVRKYRYNNLESAIKHAIEWAEKMQVINSNAKTAAMQS